MRHNLVLVALSALTVASAQSHNFTIDPNSVKPSDRTNWCNAQYETCRKLCNNGLKTNDCDDTTLAYDCKCSNGTAPGLEYYFNTIPTFICEQAYADCIAANTASSRAQDKCKSDIKEHCGTLDPDKADLGGSADTTSSSSSAAAPSATAPAQNAPSSSTSTGAAAAPTAFYLGNGVAMVAAGVFAAML
ncbi:hypothetical protein VTJ83DRAFT_2358 [Remersonia thermophila]|uniref:DUF7707 domain-containing protein n=1 Tax=Remersonia thermophila TaxID=72144 RepID=A0ABR4DIM7_9PEZI